MRCTFHVDGDAHKVWFEDWGVAPVAGAVINHEGQAYTVRPHPTYATWSSEPGSEQATFRVTRIADQPGG